MKPLKFSLCKNGYANLSISGQGSFTRCSHCPRNMARLSASQWSISRTKALALSRNSRFRPGIGDDLIASRHLAFLSPLKAVHPGHERIRPPPHFQQAATGVRPAHRKSPQRRAAVLRTACGSSRTRTTEAPRRRRSPAPLLPAHSRNAQDHPRPVGAAVFPTRARPRLTPPTAAEPQPEPSGQRANDHRGQSDRHTAGAAPATLPDPAHTAGLPPRPRSTSGRPPPPASA